MRKRDSDDYLRGSISKRNLVMESTFMNSRYILGILYLLPVILE